jgi:hypothetical protein
MTRIDSIKDKDTLDLYLQTNRGKVVAKWEKIEPINTYSDSIWKVYNIEKDWQGKERLTLDQVATNLHKAYSPNPPQSTNNTNTNSNDPTRHDRSGFGGTYGGRRSRKSKKSRKSRKSRKSKKSRKSRRYRR